MYASVPDIIILFHGLFCDNTVSMGGIIAKQLSLNRTKGPIFGGFTLHALLHIITYLLGTMKKKRNYFPLLI